MSLKEESNYVVQPDSKEAEKPKRRGSFESVASPGYTFSATAGFAIVFVPLLIFLGKEILSKKNWTGKEIIKEYTEFDEFYGSYKSQHRDADNRVLHYAATIFTIVTLMQEERLLFAFLISMGLGYNVFYLTHWLDHGYIEMATLFLTFLIVGGIFTGSTLKPLKLMLVAYGLAWIGHFLLEENKPATFTYPTFSLWGDFKMFYELCKPFFERVKNKLLDKAKQILDEMQGQEITSFSSN